MESDSKGTNAVPAKRFSRLFYNTAISFDLDAQQLSKQISVVPKAFRKRLSRK